MDRDRGRERERERERGGGGGGGRELICGSCILNLLDKQRNVGSVKDIILSVTLLMFDLSVLVPLEEVFG